ncbi:hypothetical protein SteCoe_28699 [Stentor coeruleus]|uniref:Translin-associated factor X-interacting protein 1 N-terminal domain-containing protein n=1 Tax=Stentor coeruleus TaxID=5963 RepID=A0A1R2B7N7_9CILI|nr:hypothetical protein SteCoe_28699 [Stentor coeruleus]
MAKQTRATESLGDLVRLSSNTRSKSPQPSVNPAGFPQAIQASIKIYKDSSISPIAKTNSSALLKKKSLKRIKGISPIVGKSPSTSLLVKNQKTINNLIKKPSLKSIENQLSGITSTSYRSVTPTRILDTSHDAENFDHLNSRTKKKPMNFEMLVEKYEVYKGIFEEVIQKDKTFSSVLKKIKEIYEEFYEASLKEHTKKMKEKNDILTASLIKRDEELGLLDKRIRKISTENYELAKSLERSEEICNGVQDRLNRISKFSLENVPKDEQTWKSLIIENEAYSISFKNMESKIKSAKSNEKKLRQLVLEIKKSGFPVEEFYEKTIKKEIAIDIKHKDIGSETSGSECLVSKRAQVVIKPSQVPELELDKVEPESFTSSDTYSECYDHS